MGGMTIGSVLRRVCERHGADVAMSCVEKIARVMIGDGAPVFSLDSLRDQVVRRDPADPIVVALRACNATSTREFCSALALLSASKAAVQDTDEAAGSMLWVAGLLMEIVAGDSERNRCVSLLIRVLAEEHRDQVVRVIGKFNAEASSGHGKSG